MNRELAPWPAMVRVCMIVECRKFLGLKPVTLKGQDGMLSHGLCEDCRSEMMKQINPKETQ